MGCHFLIHQYTRGADKYCLIPLIQVPSECMHLSLTAHHYVYPSSLVAQLVKDLPAMQETPVQFLGGEDPLEEGMATYSNILAWRIPMNRDAWWGTIFGVAKSQKQLSN